MDLLLDITASLILVALGALILWFGFRSLQTNEVAARLDKYVSDESLQLSQLGSAYSLVTRELTGSIISRVILPRLQQVGLLLARLTPSGALNVLEQRLTIAGNPLGLGARGFLVIRYAMLFIGIWITFLFLSRGFTRDNVLLSAVMLLLTALVPPLWLTSRMRARQNTIRGELPDALDMLSVLATAGLGFDQSLQQISEHQKTPLATEFGRVVTEINMGVTRQEALRNLVQRVELVELSTFVSLIIQAEQIGMSIAETLHAQAEQMRMFRRFRAEEQIQKIPTKLLFPLAFLIFPSILAVVLGPALPVLFDFFQGF